VRSPHRINPAKRCNRTRSRAAAGTATKALIKHCRRMAAVVERVLAGLDEDLLEYVTGLCEDTDDDGDLAEAVAAFCLSSELCEDEDDAEAKAQELLKALGRGASKPVVVEKPPSPKVKPRAPSAALAAAKSVFTAPPPAAAPVVQTTRAPPKEKKPKKAPKRVEDKNSVANKKMRLEAEMEAARVRACRARWARGAHKGAIEAKNFSLPNPGGGTDCGVPGPFYDTTPSTRLVFTRRGFRARFGRGRDAIRHTQAWTSSRTRPSRS
jgi:hypothetical protein